MALAYLPLAWVGDHYLNLCARPGVRVLRWPVRKAPTRRWPICARSGPTFLFCAAARARNAADARDDPAWRMCRPPQAQAVSLFPGYRAPCYGERILNGESGAADRAAALLRSEQCPGLRSARRTLLGFSRVRVAYTAGEAVDRICSTSIVRSGSTLKQLYGQTEAFLYVTAQPDGEIYSDTVGPAMPERRHPHRRTMARFNSNRRACSLAISRTTDKTAEAMTPDGYVMTGRRRLLRREDRPSQDHRSRQGCRQAEGRHAVPAEIYREQAQVLSQHPRSGRLRRQARFRHCDDQHRSHRGRLLGPSAPVCVYASYQGTRRPSVGLRHRSRSMWPR